MCLPPEVAPSSLLPLAQVDLLRRALPAPPRFPALNIGAWTGNPSRSSGSIHTSPGTSCVRCATSVEDERRVSISSIAGELCEDELPVPLDSDICI